MTDLARSTDLTAALAHRREALENLRIAQEALDAFNRAAEAAHSAMHLDGERKLPYLHTAHLSTDRCRSTRDAVAQKLDRALWSAALDRSGLTNLMSAEAKRAAREQIHEGAPEFIEANIEATFSGLLASRAEIEAEALLDTFRKVSWSYKNNLPHRLGRRLVLSGFGNHYLSERAQDRLIDLERVFCNADGRSPPPYGDSLARKVGQHCRVDQPYSDAYFEVRAFKNGNLHVIFRRPDLVEALNQRIAQLRPGALPPAR